MCNKNVTWPIKRFCLSILHIAYSAICKFVKAGGLGILKSSDDHNSKNIDFNKNEGHFFSYVSNTHLVLFL